MAEEFGNWEDARRRVDLLAVEKAGHLVVIELKRTDDGLRGLWCPEDPQILTCPNLIFNLGVLWGPQG
ncbi:hypothetical protein [Micromonospora sp. LH3U1]|uniref:hypothetical protein n=1 Tax=Micromonospora sp. LH3U1 TaxID=3018339 RepID=UPI002349CC50|nr:hypothetical protein [Micromonospora sp. LH3U1]WCN83850.1 hypothetical protein PCA76_12775 [Micromonospora sp. LH3U1]